MGRYDKIKVYNGSNFVKPSRIRVYRDGAWRDLGLDDSSNTAPMYVRKNNAFIRATLNKQINTHYLEAYTIGQFKILPEDRWGVNPTKYAWNFQGTIEKTVNQDVHVFKSNATTNTSHLTITWLADGRIRIQAKTTYGSGTTGTTYSSNAVMAGNKVNLRVYWNKGSTTCYIVFNGVTTSKAFHYAWEVSKSTNLVGDTRLKFYGTVSVTGVKYSNIVTTTTFNASSTNAADTSKRTSLGCTVETPAYTTTSWV